ncbi:hypothetical protein BDK51DRAFT_28290, partial [Blyttiomyces helicus]
MSEVILAKPDSGPGSRTPTPDISQMAIADLNPLLSDRRWTCGKATGGAWQGVGQKAFGHRVRQCQPMSTTRNQTAVRNKRFLLASAFHQHPSPPLLQDRFKGLVQEEAEGVLESWQNDGKWRGHALFSSFASFFVARPDVPVLKMEDKGSEVLIHRKSSSDPERLFPRIVYTEVSAAYVSWTKYFGDNTTVAKPLFRAALADSGRRHDVHVDAPSKGVTSKRFRSKVLSEGPFADMFADGSEFRLAEDRGSTSFKKSGGNPNEELSISKVKSRTSLRLLTPARLHENLLLLRVQAPAVHALWTKYFGDALEVYPFFAPPLMNAKIFRALVLGSGPVADIFASGPGYGSTEDHDIQGFGRVHPPRDRSDVPLGNDGRRMANDSASIPDFSNSKESEPGSGIVRDGDHLVSTSPYITIDPKLRIETLQLLRTEYPQAYQFWTVNFGARETTTAEKFRETLHCIDRNLALSVPLTASKSTSRVSSFEPEPSVCSDFNRKFSTVQLRFRDQLEILLRIENPAAHSLWLSSFQHARLVRRTHFCDDLRRIGIQLDMKLNNGPNGFIAPSALRKMISREGPLAAAFPSAEPELLACGLSSSADDVHERASHRGHQQKDLTDKPTASASLTSTPGTTLPVLLREIFVRTRGWTVSERRRNLTSWMLVCKPWFEVAAEVLWGNPPFTNGSARRQATNFGQLVASMGLQAWREPLTRMWCPNLRSLRLWVPDLLNRYRPSPRWNIASLAEIFLACPHLVAFEFYARLFPFAKEGFWESPQGTGFAIGISRLRLLQLRFTEEKADSHLDTLARINRSVGVALEHWHADGPWESMVQAVAQAANLKYLKLATITPNIVLHVTTALSSVKLSEDIASLSTFLPELLAACSLLDELDFGGNAMTAATFELLGLRVTPDTITRYLSRGGGRLRRLVLPPRHKWEEDERGELVAALPELRFVGIKEGRVGWGRPGLKVGRMTDEEERLMSVQGLDPLVLAGVGVVWWGPLVCVWNLCARNDRFASAAGDLGNCREQSPKLLIGTIRALLLEATDLHLCLGFVLPANYLPTSGGLQKPSLLVIVFDGMLSQGLHTSISFCQQEFDPADDVFGIEAASMGEKPLLRALLPTKAVNHQPGSAPASSSLKLRSPTIHIVQFFKTIKCTLRRIDFWFITKDLRSSFADGSPQPSPNPILPLHRTHPTTPPRRQRRRPRSRTALHLSSPRVPALSRIGSHIDGNTPRRQVFAYTRAPRVSGFQEAGREEQLQAVARDDRFWVGRRYVLNCWDWKGGDRGFAL